jgi:hypothetical protein
MLVVLLLPQSGFPLFQVPLRLSNVFLEVSISESERLGPGLQPLRAPGELLLAILKVALASVEVGDALDGDGGGVDAAPTELSGGHPVRARSVPQGADGFGEMVR